MTDFIYIVNLFIFRKFFLCLQSGRVWRRRFHSQGGLRILDRLDAMQGRNLYQRIKLSKLDMVAMLWQAVRMISNCVGDLYFVPAITRSLP